MADLLNLLDSVFAMTMGKNQGLLSSVVDWGSTASRGRGVSAQGEMSELS